MTRVQSQSGPGTTGICSLRHRAFTGSKVLAKWNGQSVFTKFRVASCRCFAPCPGFASCNCCHDPFIVRSAQNRPPFTGFTQSAHPYRCSRSTMTTVCFCLRSSCALISLGLCVHFGSRSFSALQSLHQIHHGLHHLYHVVSVLDSFLYPEVPRVNVFRSLSYSQSIRQRIRRRTVTLYFNLHWNSQTLVHRSQG